MLIYFYINCLSYLFTMLITFQQQMIVVFVFKKYCFCNGLVMNVVLNSCKSLFKIFACALKFYYKIKNKLSSNYA